MAISIMMFQVSVVYTRPLQEMIADGRYDEIDYGLDRYLLPIAVRPSGMVILNLVFYERPPLVTNGMLFEDLKDHSMRAAETSEILALGAKYPFLQQEFPIAAFGSRDAGYSGGHTRYPCLDYQNGHRRLTRVWDDPYNNWKNQGGAILAVDL